MKKFFLLFLGVFCIAGGEIKAEIFKINYFSPEETKLVAKDKTSHQLLWQSVLKLEKVTERGRETAHSVETGGGFYGKNRKNLNWIFEADYIFDGWQLVPAKAKFLFKDKAGTVIRRLEKTYDFNTRRVLCYLDGKKQEFFLRPDLVGTEFIGTFMANYPFEEKRDFIFYLLTNEPTVYKMTLKFRGTEVIQAAGREISCYKIEMIPDLGALGIFGAFVPKTYFWLEKAAPHKFVRYEGLESGLGTPYIVEEIAQ